jgi:hypothetical protein
LINSCDLFPFCYISFQRPQPQGAGIPSTEGRDSTRGTYFFIQNEECPLFY